jgi:8-oxo-dGTP pyrophosphatase MutT (NUDIX family)
MGFLDPIQALNGYRPGGYLPWFIDGHRVGRIRPALADRLLGHGSVFVAQGAGLGLNPRLGAFDARSAALGEVVDALVRDGFLAYEHGERYGVTAGRREDALCVLDRAAAAQFGIRAFGQHVNGFVRRPDGLHLWIGRRARDRRNWPGRLDNLAAGGLPYGVTLAANLAKECWEEAGVPAGLARRAAAVGAVTYAQGTDDGFKADVLYCYDLELPADFQPIGMDGEMESFELLPLPEAAALVRDTTEFKPNCSLVVLDFLVRHGVVGPEHPEYLDIVGGLHAALDPPL